MQPPAAAALRQLAEHPFAGALRQHVAAVPQRQTVGLDDDDLAFVELGCHARRRAPAARTTRRRAVGQSRRPGRRGRPLHRSSQLIRSPPRSTCAAGTPAERSSLAAGPATKLARPRQVEVAVDVEQVGTHRLRDFAGAGARRRRSIDSATSNWSSASDQARHWLARKCPSLRVASQNSDSDGAASSDRACSIRLLTGAKPVSQAANTSGRCAFGEHEVADPGPRTVTAMPASSAPDEHLAGDSGSPSSRAMKNCRLRSSQGQLATGRRAVQVVARRRQAQRHRLPGQEAQAVAARRLQVQQAACRAPARSRAHAG